MHLTGYFLNLTIEVVTFRLRGWYTLGVFLLQAFTRLGHERPCDDKTSVYTLIRAITRPRFSLSSKRVLGGMESEPMFIPREKSPLSEKKNPQR